MIDDSYIQELRDKNPISLKQEKRGHEILNQLEKLDFIKKLLIESAIIYNNYEKREIWFEDLFHQSRDSFNESYTIASKFSHNNRSAITLESVDADKENLIRLDENIKELLLGKTSGILLYSFIKIREDESLLTDFEGKRQNIVTIEESAKSLLNSLQNKVATQITYDYANIFLNQSKLHSKKIANGKETFFSSSTKWLFLGLSFTIMPLALLVFDFNFFSFLYIDYSDTHIKIVSTWLKRITIVGILLYIAKFSFNQFSINQHLATLNKHRSNALQTFKLFIDSISQDDSQTKNILLLEVAKTIFDVGHTGFLNKDQIDIKGSSIHEVTKVLGQVPK
ncbi:hypothetical protein EHQ46_16125 [Leptospira yanagawae]|uniref:Uncharacterized protein n=1 Tax=Leptospira yanagawae TaxID=293069 RepID=A0ABY2LXW4_9LEPT|nr:hypothetical protein [Leptospira yanagawae]TGL17714.1 hypothetical protein EHQ46_16125 [Leptospira yanagawae]